MGKRGGGQPRRPLAFAKAVKKRLKQLIGGARGDGSGKLKTTAVKEWCARVAVPLKTCLSWLDEGTNAVPGTDNLVTMAENSPGLSLDWLLLNREPDFYKSQPLPFGRLASELRGYVIGRLVEEGDWTAQDLDRWIASGEEILDVLVRLNSERATYHLIYERARGKPAPVDLTPSSSTLGMVPVTMTRDLRALLEEAS